MYATRCDAASSSFKSSSGGALDEALCFLRVALADEELLTQLESRDPLEALRELDAAGEERVKAYLDDILAKMQERAGPPRAEDEAALAGLEPGPRAFALHYRMTRRAILGKVREGLKAP